MKIHPLAGKPAPQDLLVDIDKSRKEYYARKPDITDSRQSGLVSAPAVTGAPHCVARSMKRAITQAICEYRHSQGITGPLYIGKDTHALSTWKSVMRTTEP